MQQVTSEVASHTENRHQGPECLRPQTAQLRRGLVDGMASVDVACEQRSARHHGVISRAEAIKLGMSPKQIRHRVGTRRWIQLFPGVYFIAGTRPTWEARIVGAVKWAGPTAACGARSAAALFELDGCRKGQPEIVTPREITRAPFRCHRTNYLPGHHLRTKDGIRVTRPARTVFDLGPLVGPDAFRRAATDALRRKLTSLGELRAVLGELQASGRNGTLVLRNFLQGYDPRLSLTANEFEASLFRLLMKAHLALPVPQQPVYDDEGRIVRVDFIYFDARIVIEADGFAFHDDPFAVARDNARRRRLTLDGWLVLTFTWRDVMFQPDDVVADVRRALKSRA